MRKAPAFAAVALVVLLSGCADPANWPKQPLLAFVDGNIRSGDIGYDLNRDGRVDYIQHIEGGLKTRFRIDSNGDGVFDIEFDRGGAPGDRHRTLVVLLDGIDFETMDALWAEGRFRLFHRPAPLISSFPSVTDTGWADVFNAR
ncbi:MAG: hypothetical protein QGD94_02595, partial [Planctomycetia bacterium]|nr:hypothetical protein [Planctomycetia bacterium]